MSYKEFLYATLNGLINTKVSWQLFKDRKNPCEAFKNFKALNCFKKH
jgi:hypothetical protein